MVDFVGADSTLALAAKIGRKQGHLTVVGLAGGKLAFDFFALPYECSVATTYWGTLPELMEVIALAEAGKIKPHIQSFPLDPGPRSLPAAKAGKAGRARGHRSTARALSRKPEQGIRQCRQTLASSD